MQVNRPHQPAPAYDNKQGQSPAAPPARPPQPRMYAPVPPPPPPQPPAEEPQGRTTTGDPKAGTREPDKTAGGGGAGTTSSTADAPAPSAGGIRSRRDAPGNATPAPAASPAQPTGKEVPAELAGLQERHDTLQAQQQALAQNAPGYEAESSAYMKRFVQSHFNKDIDPRKVYLNEFVPPSRTANAVGGPYVQHNQDAGQFVKSTPLSQVPIDNIGNPLGSGFELGTKRYSISASNDPGQRYGEQRELIDPRAFYNALSDLDFKAEYKQSIDNYYKDNASALRQVRQDGAQLEVDTQFAKGQLDKPDYDLAQRGIQGYQSAQQVADEDTDNEGPADVRDEQRKAGYRNTAVYPLDVGGYSSNDSLRIEDKSSGRTLLYLPGEDKPVQAFGDKGKAIDWLKEQSKDPAWTQRFANAHFSANDAQGRTDNLGVKNYLDGEAVYRQELANPRVGYNSGTHGEHYLKSQDGIGQDPFGQLNETARDGLKRDADFDITSNADANKANLAKGFEAIPLPGTGVPGLFLAKTPGQFGQAALQTTLDLLSPGGGAPLKGGVKSGALGAAKIEAKAGSEAVQEAELGAAKSAPPQAGAGTSAATASTADAQQSHPLTAGDPASGDGPSQHAGVTKGGGDAAPQPTLAEKKPEKSHEPAKENTEAPPKTGEESTTSALSTGYEAFRSPYSTNGRTPNSEGLYDIDFKEYVPLGETSPGKGQPLYQIRKNENGLYEMVKPGEMASYQAPLIRLNRDNGSFEAVREGLDGGGPLSQIFSKDYREARKELQSAISEYEKAKRPQTAEEVNAFIAKMQNIAANGNVQDHGLVYDYARYNSGFANRPLRSGENTPELQEFMEEFNQLNDYSGKAYRSAYVTPEGAQRIRNGVGKVFIDPGVQSASVTVYNSAGWEDWAGRVVSGRPNVTQRVKYVFDEAIPKKNLATRGFEDHVGIPPGQPLKVRAIQDHDNILFVYLSAPSKTPDRAYNIYDGARIY